MIMRPLPRKLTSVDVYPMDDSETAKEFSLCCSTVYELYSAGLAGQKRMPALASWARIFVNSGTQPLDIRPSPKGRGGDFEAAHVGIGEWGQAESMSSGDYLEWLHSIMIAFALSRGYDRSYLDKAYAYCLEAGLEVHVESPRKLSPGRTHRAQLFLDIGSAGERTTRLQIWNRAGELVGGTTARDRTLVYTLFDYNRLRRRMRWSSDVTVCTNDADDELSVPSFLSIGATVGEFQGGSMINGYDGGVDNE